MIPKFARWVAVIGAAAVVIPSGLASTATAVPQSARPKCTLNVPASPRSESPASCVAVDLKLDKLPAKGETAALRVSLRSQVHVTHARLTVRVPDTLQLITEGSPLSAPRPVGPWLDAKGVVALDTNKRTFTLHVRATAEGPAQIEANLTDVDSPSPEREAHGSVLLTVGTNKPGDSASRSGVDITSLPGRSGERRSKAGLGKQEVREGSADQRRHRQRCPGHAAIRSASAAASTSPTRRERGWAAATSP